MKRDFKKWAHFFSPAIINLLLITVLVGLALFAVELGVARGLQSIFTNDPAIASARNSTALMIFFVLLRGLLIWITGFLNAMIGERFTLLSRQRIFDWIFSGTCFDVKRALLLLNDYVSKSGRAIASIQHLMLEISIAVFLLTYLLIYDLKLTVIMILATSLLVIPLRILNKKVKARAFALTEETEKMQEQFKVVLKNLTLMNIYGQVAKEKKTSTSIMQNYYNKALRSQVWFNSSISYSQTFQLALFYIIAQTLNPQDGGMVGAAVVYFYLLFRFLQQIGLIFINLANLHLDMPFLTRMIAWWEEQPQNGLSLNSKTQTSDDFAKLEFLQPVGWSLTNVSFRHLGGAQNTLENFSLEIKPGEIVALCGDSGSGKSSLIHLLLGAHAPQSGSAGLSHNGIKYLASQVSHSLAKRVGYVGAESLLIEGSVYQNLVYGLGTSASEEEIREAIMLADAMFLYQASKGLETNLNFNGDGLSTGQKQRLCLARALLRKPCALILDEATANLDTETEKRLLQTLKNLKGKMTIIIASHREAVIAIADQQVQLTGPAASG